MKQMIIILLFLSQQVFAQADSVYLLSSQQAELLKGQEFRPGNKFNPFKDSLDRDVISVEEVISLDTVQYCDLVWVKNLQIVPFLKPEEVIVEP